MAQKQLPKSMLLDGAQMALAAIIAGTMSYLKKRKIPIENWVSYIGEQFEGSWDDLKGKGTDEVMQHLLALEVLPLGAEVISSKLAADKAEVAVTTLPSKAVLEKFGTTPRELLQDFGLTQKDFASLYAMFEPSAAAIGLNFKHEVKGNQQLLSLERAPRKKK